MFGAICRVQWKGSAAAVALLAAAAFIVPLLAVQQAGFTAGDFRTWDLVVMLSAVESAGALFPILAIILGLTLSVGAWSADHQADHVYALTLPIPRWHYVLLRFGAGLVLILPVMLAVGLGCAVAVGSIDVPEGLRAYGSSITLRFGLAALVSYAATFALAVVAGLALRVAAGSLPVDAELFVRAFAYACSGLTVFHLLPIPGLDGARIVALLLPPQAAQVYRNADRYLSLFVLVLLFLLGSGVLSALTDAVCDLAVGGRCL